MAYATSSDLAGWLGATPPGDAARLLARASELLDAALIGVVYPVDDDGNPTRPDHQATFRKAVCAQVEWWIETGDETGAAGQYSSVSIGSVGLVRANSATTGRPPGRLCPRALDVLRVAGLMPVIR